MANSKFIPVRGKQEDIAHQPLNEGHIYFAYDTGNMYLDKIVDGQLTRFPLGSGSSGIVYATGDDFTISKNSVDSTDYHYTIQLAALEEQVLPSPNSLILNNDGRFFRVLSVNAADSTIQAILLAVSGTGGGSGEGGGGTGPVTTVSFKINSETLSQDMMFVYQQDWNVEITPKNSYDNYVTLTFTVTDSTNETVFEYVATRVPVERIYNFNMGQLPLGKNLKLTITMSSANSDNYSRVFTGLSVITLDLQKVNSDFIPIKKAGDNNVTQFYYMPIGDTSIGNKGKLHVYIDDVQTSVSTIDPTWYNRVNTLSIERQSYGAHDIKLIISAEINGITIYTNPIHFEAAWADATLDEPIIWVGQYDSTVINYENAYIQYMVYDPQADARDAAANITLYKDSEIIGEVQYQYKPESGWIDWDISSLYTVGNNVFSIVCRGIRKDILVYVTTEGSRDLSLSQKPSLLENFSAAGRSNTEILSNRIKWIDSTNNHYEAGLTGFNWQNNGWKKDAIVADTIDNGTYLTVANGATLSIPSPTNNPDGLLLNYDTSYTIEARFRVRNIQKYSTLVTTIPLYYYADENEYGESVKSSESKTMEWINDNNKEVWYDEYGSPLMDEEHTLKTYETNEGIFCKWLNSQGQGFVLGTQEAYFNSPKDGVNVRYKEDEVINITCVIDHNKNLVYIYLNGILSGAGELDSNKQTGSFRIPGALVFNSNYCDVDLYRFRIYSTALTMPEVIQNYLSDMHSIKLFDQNQLADTLKPTQISYTTLVQYNEDHPDELTMPYAVWKIKDSNRAEKLPYFKGDGCKVDITFVNPTLDRALEKGDIDEWYYYTHSPSFIATDVDIDVQGTSSQGYPRRNYKTKYKKASSWVFTKGSLAGESLTQDHEIDGKTLKGKFHMDNEYVGVNKFTWKIDYMESSGTYNTGFANLLGNLKHPLYTKHPLNDLGIDATGLRTTVYGYPVLTFHEYEDVSNNPSNRGVKYEYIGRYNMNLDKSANEAYGYEDGHAHPYVNGNPKIKSVAECWELSDNQGTWCSFKFPSDAARELGFGTPQNGFPDRLEMFKHFEYRYSPYGDQLDAIGAKGKYDGVVPSDKPEIGEQIGSNDAQKSAYARNVYFNLERLFFWLDSANISSATDGDIYIRQPVKDNEGVISISKVKLDEVTYPTATDYTGTLGATSVINPLGGFTTTFTKDTAGYRREKFRNEFTLHLDLEYCLVYFILTELLLCYDSRGKNMMIASFGPRAEGGEYIWYPTFYDIDTQLGLNNTGAYLWDYDADVTESGLFSTPTSALWSNFYIVFNTEIQNKYRVFRGQADGSNVSNNLTYENITGAYECNPDVFDSYAMRGIRPIVAIGLDEYYKYFEIMDTGYFTTDGTSIPGTTEFIFQCQGDKKLSTELLLRNRLNYIDSWWLGGNYQIEQMKQGQFWGRVNGNRKTDTSDRYLDMTAEQIAAAAANNSQYNNFLPGTFPVPYFDSTPEFKLKPFLKQYVSVLVDETTRSLPVKYSATQEEADGKWTELGEDILSPYRVTPESPNEQLVYLPAVDYLSSMGDLSTKYFSEIHLTAGKRLLDLCFGSDVPGYMSNALDASKPLELNNGANSGSKKALLKKCILSQINSWNKPVDMRGSEKLEEFRALSTALPSVDFANGAPLHTVHLPNTITSLSLVENSELTRILEEKPVVARWVDNTTNNTVTFSANMDFSAAHIEYTDPALYRGLYLEDITDHTMGQVIASGHSLSILVLEGGGLGYDSYKLLDKLVDIKKNATTHNILQASLKDVKWTPYSPVVYGEPYDSNTTYYELTDHSTFVSYTYNANTWDTDTLNGIVYTKDNSMDTSVITDTSLLDFLIDEYSNAQFGNTTLLSNSVPAITGTMYINNAGGTAISEEELTSKYGQYFPSLKLQVANVAEANVTRYARKLDSGVIETIETLRSTNSHPLPPTAQYPAKSGYDFIGWGLDPDNDTIFLPYNFDVNTGNGSYPENMNEYLNAYTFSAGNTVVILYAKYQVHQNIVTIWENNIKVGAALMNTNSMFVEPTIIYHYDTNNMLDTSVAYPFAPYKNDDDLALDKTYKFIGYSYASNDMATGIITERVTGIINRNINIYAVFTEEDIYNIDYSSYFDTNSPIKSYRELERETGTTLYNIDEGIELWPAPSSEKVIIGKIVIPTTWNDKTVIGIGNFWRQPGITHVFFADNHQLRYVASNCFTQSSEEDIGTTKSLKYFDFNTLSTLREIQNGAFRIVNNLCLVDSLGDNATSVLFRIGENAFNGAFGRNRSASYNMLHIPASVTIMGSYAFAYQKFTKHTISLEIGNSLQHSNLRLTPLNSASLYPTETIYENNGYEYIGQNRDQGYKYIDFYSLNYSNDTGDNELMTKLLNMLGLNRDSGSGAPETFTLHNGANNWQLINNT